MNFNKGKTYQDIYNMFDTTPSTELLEYLALRYKLFCIDYCEEKEAGLTEVWIRSIILEILTKRNNEEMFVLNSREE